MREYAGRLIAYAFLQTRRIAAAKGGKTPLRPAA